MALFYSAIDSRDFKRWESKMHHALQLLPGKELHFQNYLFLIAKYFTTKKAT